MVFSNNRKPRKGAKKQPVPKLTIQDLPDELMLDVLDYTPLSDILKLRLSGRVLVPVASTAMRARLKVIYVNPSIPSIYRALNIIRSDLSSDIEEVCFVNRFLGCNVSMWPQNIPQSSKGKIKGLDSQEPDHPRASLVPTGSTLQFAKTYGILLSALASLPNLQHFCLARDCEQPGFNMAFKIDEKRVNPYIKPTIRSSITRCQKAEEKLYGKDPRPYSRGFTDVEAIMAILSHPNIKITRLRIADHLVLPAGMSQAITSKTVRQSDGTLLSALARLSLVDSPTILPDSFVSTLSRLSIFHPSMPPDSPHHLAPPVSARIASLTRLELCSNIGWPEDDWQKMSHALLQEAAPSLQNLVLAFKYNVTLEWRGSRHREKALSSLVNAIDFPNLEQLDLRALQPPDDASKTVMLDFDLSSFVSQMCPKLQVLRSSAVVVAPGLFAATSSTMPYVSLDQMIANLDQDDVEEIEAVGELSRVWKLGGVEACA